MNPNRTLNLNSHSVRVLTDEGEFINFPRYKAKPRIKYERVKDNNESNTYRLVTVGVENLPNPMPKIKYLVNRDTIRAVRILEKKILNLHPELKEIISQKHWRKKIKSLNLNEDLVSEAIKYIDRKDLRAPGEQVRNKETHQVEYCLGLISEFE
jgi:hypothetical protein